jgi:hypothetical protein
MGEEGPGKDTLFGPWSDPAEALRRYQAYCTSGAADNGKSNRPGGIGEICAGRPGRVVLGRNRPQGREETRGLASPTGTSPFAHRNGQWAKEIRHKIHYFGPWEDPDAALQRYVEQEMTCSPAGRHGCNAPA